MQLWATGFKAVCCWTCTVWIWTRLPSRTVTRSLSVFFKGAHRYYQPLVFPHVGFSLLLRWLSPQILYFNCVTKDFCSSQVDMSMKQNLFSFYCNNFRESHLFIWGWEACQAGKQIAKALIIFILKRHLWLFCSSLWRFLYARRFPVNWWKHDSCMNLLCAVILIIFGTTCCASTGNFSL